MNNLRERVAVVTGAASGIGFALSERFTAEGMKVVMADVEAPALAAAAGRLRHTASGVLACEVDVSRPDDVERLARETYAAFGGARALQQRGRGRDRRGPRAHARGLAVGHRREPLGRDPRGAGV